MRDTVASPRLATHTSSFATAMPAGSAPTSIGRPTTAASVRSMLRTVPARASVTQTSCSASAIPAGSLPTGIAERAPAPRASPSRTMRSSPAATTQANPVPTATPAESPPTSIAAPATRPVLASMRVNVPSPALATSTSPRSASTAIPSGPRPTRTGAATVGSPRAGAARSSSPAVSSELAAPSATVTSPMVSTAATPRRSARRRERPVEVRPGAPTPVATATTDASISGAAKSSPNCGPSSVHTAAAPIVATILPTLRTMDREPNADQRNRSGATCAMPTSSATWIAPLAAPAARKHAASAATVPSRNANPTYAASRMPMPVHITGAGPCRSTYGPLIRLEPDAPSRQSM